MATQDKRTWNIDGEIIDADITAQKVTVRTSHGEVLSDVPISSPSLSTRDKSGIHSFPRKGDRCWLTRDVDRWYVASFGPTSDMTGNFTADRPELFRAGGQHIHADLSGLDVLPSFAASGGTRLYATEKLGVTYDGASTGTSGGSSTTSVLGREFDGAAIVRGVFPADGCSSGVATDPAKLPAVTSVNVGAILLNRTLSSMPDVSVTIKGRYFNQIMDKTKPTAERVVLSVSDGFPSSLLTVTSADFTDSDPFNGSITILVKRNLTVSPLTPDGVFDLVFTHPKTGVGVRVVAGLSINSFTPASSRRVFFSVPTGLSIGFSRQPDDIADFGAFFAVRKEIASAVLQELEAGNATVDNSKYIGVTGAFADLLAVYDSSGAAQDSNFFNSLRTDSLTLAEIEALPAPVLGFEIVGVGADQAASDAITSRLTSAAQQVTVFGSDTQRKNLGIELDNFQSGDKFRITVYKDQTTAAPDYTQPPLIFAVDPGSIELPNALFLEIQGENFRIGSDFSLVQSTQLTGIGTSSEAFVPVVGAAPVIGLGLDTSTQPHALTLSNAGSNSISGAVSVYRVSDKSVGLYLNVSQITQGLYGEYNLTVLHADGAHSPTSQTRVLKILPVRASSGSGGSTSTSSTVNVLRQQVLAQDSAGVDTELYRYAVDENGRLDITARGGVYFDGKAAPSASLVGRITAGSNTTVLVSDLGDAGLVALNGNILIAALHASPTDTSRGDVRIHADSCLTAGQGTPTVNIARRSQKVQVATAARRAQFGGKADSIENKFPVTIKHLDAPGQFGSKDLVSIGPLLILAEDQQFSGQVVMNAGNTPSGLGHTYFSLRSRAHFDKKYLEGRLNLVFVPNGLGAGTEDDPYTGTWHVPLA